MKSPETERLAAKLREDGVSRLALLLDNSPAWAVADLAALAAGIALVPVPAFFTTGQIAHLLVTSGAALQGTASREMYVGFLTEAYHHVRHTVPLVMACGARLPDRLEWLRATMGRYIEEEMGHQEWILDDLTACGADAQAVRNGWPGRATEMMVAYAWDMVSRVDPVGFLGMVHVLEGTSTALAHHAASALRRHLGLPKGAFTYLDTHGGLDLEHVAFFESLVNRLTEERDRAIVIHAARRFYHLYGEIFRGLEEPMDQAA